MGKMIWGTPVEMERRRRIFLSVWAYADVFMNRKIVTYEEYQYEARRINLSLNTGDTTLDDWWKKNFRVDKTDWICQHPYPRELHILAIRLLRNQAIESPVIEGRQIISIERITNEPVKKEQFPQEEAA